MKTFEFVNMWGEKKKVAFYKGNYVNNNRIYIGYMCDDEDFPDSMIPYGDVTVNLDSSITGENYGFLDTNNCDPKLIQFLTKNGWIEDTGFIVPSGYCVYPIVKFTDEFLNEICEEMR